MTIKPIKTDGQVFCAKCKDYTGNNTENVVFVKTSRSNMIKVLCAQCKYPKSAYIQKSIMKQFPEIDKALEILNVKESISGHQLKDSEGGILPLLPLLGAIFGGITAAGSTATAVAVPVLNKQKADAEIEEQRRHNTEMEKLARGDGLLTINKQTSDSLEDEMIESAKTFLSGKGFIFV